MEKNTYTARVPVLCIKHNPNQRSAIHPDVGKLSPYRGSVIPLTVGVPFPGRGSRSTPATGKPFARHNF
jgi:hypothetical protein